MGQGAVRGTVGFDSVRHSDPGAFGETVAVGARDGVVRVEVTDRAGLGTREQRPAGRDAEAGWGFGSLRAPLRGGGGGAAGGW